MKYSICIEPLLEENFFEDKVKIINEIGFEAVELWDSSNKDLDRGLADQAVAGFCDQKDTLNTCCEFV